MFCRNCGKEVSPNVEICLTCGVRLTNSTKYCNNCGVKTTDNQELCVKCGVRLARYIPIDLIETREKNPKIKTGTKILIGCGSILALPFVLMVFLAIFSVHREESDKRKVLNNLVIEGNIARIEILLKSSMSLDYASTKVGNTVWIVAKYHPEIDKLSLHLRLSKKHIRDVNNKPLKEDLDMGYINLIDLDEIRKYPSDLSFSQNKENKQFFMEKISNLNYGIFIRD